MLDGVVATIGVVPKEAEMLYRSDEKCGNRLSILGFGCMRFARSLTNQIDVARAESLVLKAVERGVNYFDTAYVYNGSEVALGSVLARNPGTRERIKLASKIPPRSVHRLEDAESILAEQLSRLQTDHIDYYLIHNVGRLATWEQLVELGIEDWLAQKQAEGVLGSIGFSFHGAQQEFMALLDAYDWGFCQIQYNYMNENYQAGTAGLKAAAAKGLPIIIMEPLLGGKLASGLPSTAQKAFREVEPERSFAEWGLRWVWDHPEATVVLSGMNAPEQLADNVAAVERIAAAHDRATADSATTDRAAHDRATADSATTSVLTDAERAVYPRVREAFKAAFRIPCTGCNYCMPCPHNVNIPGCFAAYNISFVTGFASGQQQYLTSTGMSDPDGTYGPDNCVRCGACEKKCPQNIAIMDELVTVKKRMEPWWLSAVLAVVRRFL
jgi:predicted aldo/keto reductase-like oxidoreductase